MSQQRAFAQKLNKTRAADLRRQVVSTGSFKSVEFPASVSRSSFSTGFTVCDVVDPVDFEECVNQRKTNSFDSGSFNSWNIRQFGDFPPDDLELKFIPRETLYIDSPFSSDLNFAKLDFYVKDILAAYSFNFVAINRKYELYSTGEVYKRKCGEKFAIVQCLPRQNFEIDLDEEENSQRASYASDSTAGSSNTGGNVIDVIGTARESWASSGCDLQQSAADPILQGVVDRVSPVQMDATNDCKREKNRQSQLFAIFALQHEDEVVEKRQIPPLPSEVRGHRLFVRVLSLKMEFEFEPVFASVALYDAKDKKKVSENFYFDCNPDVIKGMLKSHVPYQDLSSLCRSAIYSVMHPSNDLFLVFRLEKILQAGDINETVDAYLKEDKNKDKLKTSALDYCDRLGGYRMPFAWAAIDLSKVIGGAATLERSESVPPTPLSATGDAYTSDSDSIVSASTFDRQSQLSGSGTLKRVGSGHGQSSFVRKGSLRASGRQQKDDLWNIDNFCPLTLTVNNFFKQESDKLSDEDLFKYLTEVRRPSSLAKKLKCIPGIMKIDISPWSEETANCLSPELLRIAPFHDEDVNVAKELLEFPLKEVYAPNYGYRNLLYVYPKFVNFSGRPGSARNISINVQLLQGQDLPLQVNTAIFGKSSCPALSTFYNTTVNYHNKSPQFYDEIKLSLPANLNDTHHLLFTFYHISCRPKTALESSNLETPIGYAWLPLYSNSQLPSGEYNLPVSLDPLPPCYFYLAPDINLPNVKWLDNHKLVFNLKVEAVTTIYTQDKHLDSFLHSYRALQAHINIPPTLNEPEMHKIIRNLTKAKPEPLVNFLYIILDKLVDLMINPPVVHNQIWNFGQTCFEMFGQIAKILTFLVDGFCDQHNRSSLLTAYIQYSHVTQPGSEHSSRSGSVEGNAAARTPYAPSHPFVDMRRTSSDPEVGPPLSPGHNDLMDIIRGFEKSPIFRPDSGSSINKGNLSRKFLHEELALQWVVSSGAAREMACGNAWFFFELITKSMGEYLLATKRIYLARKLRFSQQFLDDVTTLITTLTSEVISRCGKDMRLVQNLNCSVAFFLRDAFSLMDRTFVFNLIRAYCKQIMAKVNTLPELANLLMLKLEFLRIVSSHEHYITLNLPFASGPLPLTIHQQSSGGVPAQQQPPSPSPSLSSRSSGGSVTVSSTSSGNSVGPAELTNEFRSHHFLTGLILTDLAGVLESRNRLLHNKAINVVRNLLSSHDSDPRLTDPVVKSKVASLYFPLLGIVMDAYGQLFDPYGQRSKPVSSVIANDDEHTFETYSAPGFNPNITMMVIAGGASQTFSAPGTVDRLPSAVSMGTRRSTLSFDSTRNLLICFCWIVKNLDRLILRQWLSELSQLRLTQLLDILQLCVSCFEYKGRGVQKEKASRGVKPSELKFKLEDTLFGHNSARLELISRNKTSTTSVTPTTETPVFASPDSGNNTLTSATNSGGVRWRKEHIQQYRHNVDYTTSGNVNEKLRFEMENDPVSEGNLSTEINTVVLDVLELIGKVLASSEQTTGGGVMNLVVRVMLHMLACNQSVAACYHLFASQRALVAKYPDLLFEEETEQCADLCLQLLRHCAGRLQPVRAQAAASLYLLLRQGFESGSNFARVKMQITVSLSSLVGTTADGKWFNEENLRRSLKTVLTYAETDTASPSELSDTTFCEQVKDLIFNLHMILSDTVKMKEFQHDFEMLTDLMYRIAKGYQNSPDLRLTWLQSLAQKHYERTNYAEAAQCYVHAAALAAEYMHMLEDLQHLPTGAVTFLKLSDNVLEESAVSDDVVSPDEEGICVSGHFVEAGLCALLEQGAAMFQQAQMYEAAYELFKILLPVHENQRNFPKMSAIYSTLAECLAKVDNKFPSADKRMFGTFFRVGFYGTRFGDLDGQEFVYREPAITKLPEISHRLESFYTDRFGQGVVIVVKDSNAVDRSRLESDKAYLQITYVEPYFESWELRRRCTHFELNFNVRRFVYSTPFTLDGRAHGELKEQYKRKTILTTSHCFPYVKTRILVVHKEQFVLTPIEVAIEDIRKKTKELAIATTQEPKDVKMLQMVLQGCIGTTVNQGPLEIANVFLSGVVDGRKPMDKLQNKLRLSFKDFSKKCYDALRENKRWIGADQREYHRELERNYVLFTERLRPMVSVVGNAPKTSSSAGHRSGARGAVSSSSLLEHQPDELLDEDDDLTGSVSVV